MRTLIGIAGKSCSGKTTLARHLLSWLDGNLLSFGDYVRRISPSGNLQDLGQHLVESNADDFIENFLSGQKISTHPFLIIEGVRHVNVWKRLQERYFQNLLVVIDPPESILVARMRQTKGLSPDEAMEHLHHPVESQVQLLATVADILFREESHVECSQRIREKLKDLQLL
jgi:dephospho-CoA kinase